MSRDGVDATYKIGRAAEMLGVKPYVLRFWESEFEDLEPVRTRSGQRLYTRANIELVRKIKALLYDEGLTIEGAKKRLAEDDRSGLLLEIRQELLEIRELLSQGDEGGSAS